MSRRNSSDRSEYQIALLLFFFVLMIFILVFGFRERGFDSYNWEIVDYIIAPDERVWDIAKKNIENTTVGIRDYISKLKEINPDIKDMNNIQSGTKIKIYRLVE